MIAQTGTYKKELLAELNRILDYWATMTVDNLNGGFYGKIDNENRIDATAPKGVVLNARILWSFAAAYNFKPEARYLEIADRACQYIITYFTDNEYGGIYWSVDQHGKPLDTRKQVYAIAFTIYAFSEFYKASGREEVKERAVDLFHLLLEKAYDPVRTGFYEAFTKDWQPIADLRLSAKDQNEKKTMNTHLHLLEAFTNLYRIWPDETLKEHIARLTDNFLDHFIDQESNHLRLFFDENWQSRSQLVSYGHDIEASWLLLQAAEVIADEQKIDRIKDLTIKIADATMQALDANGGLWYEYEPATAHLVKEKHWWVQSEAMVGFFNAWQLSGEEKYLTAAFNSWNFIQDKILDTVNGEWFWGIDENNRVMHGEDKAGFWKCPYHNTRACIEIINR